MPLASTKAITLFGLTGTLLNVEADISSNLPNFILVGLPDASLSESTSRVRAACTNSGLSLPGRRITVNLSPAAVPKRGSSFDLAIAVAVLAAHGTLNQASVQNWLHIGELGLDGAIRPVTGVLPSVLAAKQLGVTKIVVPLANLAEATAVTDIEIEGFSHLTQVARFHGAEVETREVDPKIKQAKPKRSRVGCFSDVLGQGEAIDALTIAAAGGHHLLMVGAPGAGKTMLASRLPGILPRLTPEESIESAAIRSLSGLVGELDYTPPFQAPHHSSSASSLIGGGLTVPKPGLISLAHNGVLFLDEAPEFQTPALEALRQPLETGEVYLARAGGVARFPARFQLVMAANPCPCGMAWERGNTCQCAATAKARYIGKLSGPLLDRVDIQLKVQRQPKALAAKVNETSENIAKRVVAARAISREVLFNTPWKLYGQVPGTYLRKHLKPASQSTANLDRALEKGLISMRGYDRCLRLALTIASMRGAHSASSDDLAHAVYLRGADL